MSKVAIVITVGSGASNYLLIKYWCVGQNVFALFDNFYQPQPLKTLWGFIWGFGSYAQLLLNIIDLYTNTNQAHLIDVLHTYICYTKMNM